MRDLFNQNEIADTPAYKLVRRDDPSTSHNAAESIDATAMERIVLNAIKRFGSTGCISDEVCEALPNHRYSTITARYKQLKEKNFVIVNGTKRKAESGRQQMVMWASEYYPEGE